MKLVFAFALVVLLAGCAGMKVVTPEEQENKGTKQLDFSGGTLKVVDTYTCSIVASNGKRVSAIGKSEEETRNEAMAKCRDQTLVSFCKVENVRCAKN